MKPAVTFVSSNACGFASRATFERSVSAGVLPAGMASGGCVQWWACSVTDSFPWFHAPGMAWT